MCARLIPSWSFTSTFLKKMNKLSLLPRMFIGNWAAACYSCSLFYSSADPNSRGLNTSFGWFYPAANSSSCDWIRAVWKAVTALYVKSMHSFHYIMKCPHCVMWFFIWYVLFSWGYTFILFGFVLLSFGYTLTRFSFTFFSFHNVLLSFGYELFLFGYGLFSFSHGFFKYALFLWLYTQLI